MFSNGRPGNGWKSWLKFTFSRTWSCLRRECIESSSEISLYLLLFMRKQWLNQVWTFFIFNRNNLNNSSWGLSRKNEKLPTLIHNIFYSNPVRYIHYISTKAIIFVLFPYIFIVFYILTHTHKKEHKRKGKTKEFSLYYRHKCL